MPACAKLNANTASKWTGSAFRSVFLSIGNLRRNHKAAGTSIIHASQTAHCAANIRQAMACGDAAIGPLVRGKRMNGVLAEKTPSASQHKNNHPHIRQRDRPQAASNKPDEELVSPCFCSLNFMV